MSHLAGGKTLSFRPLQWYTHTLPQRYRSRFRACAAAPLLGGRERDAPALPAFLVAPLTLSLPADFVIALFFVLRLAGIGSCTMPAGTVSSTA